MWTLNDLAKYCAENNVTATIDGDEMMASLWDGDFLICDGLLLV